MLETVAVLAGWGNNELTADDLQEFFVGVAGQSIEGNILKEVGKNSVRLPSDLAAVERAQRMLHGFVDRFVRDRFATSDLSLAEIAGQEIDGFVTGFYSAAFDLLQTGRGFMRRFSLIGRLGPDYKARVAVLQKDSVVYKIDFLNLNADRRLDFGIGHALDQLASLDLTPTDAA